MNKVLAKFASYTGYFVQVAAITHCTFEYLFDFVLCSGPSMVKKPLLFALNFFFLKPIFYLSNRSQHSFPTISSSRTNCLHALEKYRVTTW